ncbi:Fur family transcriptional regulator [Segeticoccus rhizosphaerae]|jgi:Fe2+ or Zn2+ uptake regulation protein|uniref:Fur family transcriptional regulator n=1 Tax=Segeticoccus rhizosphaerae TaxID=1104777 RepID=UPI0010C12D5A|nr:Fur family transcriptional regulator [Ornithinicoccus soli]
MVTAESSRHDVLVQRAADLLHHAGERMTGPRRVVLQALAGDGHLSAEAVVEQVKAIDPTVHRASVYRALETLSRLGLVQHVHLGHGATAYHLVDEEHPHAHCLTCGRVIDLPEQPFRALAESLRDESGFVLDAGHIALSGQCGACRAGSTS